MGKMKLKYISKDGYCKEYMRYLGVAKTERRSFSESVRLLESNGFREISKFKTLKPGDRVYRGREDRTVMAAVIGRKAISEAGLKYLGRPLNRIDIRHFPDGETFCQVIDGVRGKDVFVIQSGSPSPNDAYMELFIIMDALKRGSAARITAVVPYYGYARQDRCRSC